MRITEHAQQRRTELKGDWDRRNDEHDTWNGRGHGLNGGDASDLLGSVNRSDRTRKLLSIGTELEVLSSYVRSYQREKEGKELERLLCMFPF